MARDKTNHTHFRFWLDDNPDEVDGLAPSRRAYRKKCGAKAKRNGRRFGQWLFVHRKPTFLAFYKSYWLKHEELW